MVTQFKCGLIGDTHSEVTIMPLEDLNFLQHQFLLINQEGNVSQLLLKQEWLFLVTTKCSTLPITFILR